MECIPITHPTRPPGRPNNDVSPLFPDRLIWPIPKRISRARPRSVFSPQMSADGGVAARPRPLPMPPRPLPLPPRDASAAAAATAAAVAAAAAAADLDDLSDTHLAVARSAAFRRAQSMKSLNLKGRRSGRAFGKKPLGAPEGVYARTKYAPVTYRLSGGLEPNVAGVTGLAGPGAAATKQMKRRRMPPPGQTTPIMSTFTAAPAADPSRVNASDGGDVDFLTDRVGGTDRQSQFGAATGLPKGPISTVNLSGRNSSKTHPSSHHSSSSSIFSTASSSSSSLLSSGSQGENECLKETISTIRFEKSTFEFSYPVRPGTLTWPVPTPPRLPERGVFSKPATRAQASAGMSADGKQKKKFSQVLAEAEERRKQNQAAANARQKEGSDHWMCHFCEYERLFGVKPEALIRRFEIRDLQRRRRQAKLRLNADKSKPDEAGKRAGRRKKGRSKAGRVDKSSEGPASSEGEADEEDGGREGDGEGGAEREGKDGGVEPEQAPRAGVVPSKLAGEPEKEPPDRGCCAD